MPAIDCSGINNGVGNVTCTTKDDSRAAAGFVCNTGFKLQRVGPQDQCIGMYSVTRWKRGSKKMTSVSKRENNADTISRVFLTDKNDYLNNPCGSCRPGYTLNSDQKTCTPNACRALALSDPAYDARDCVGKRTGETCKIQCADGYVGGSSVYNLQRYRPVFGCASRMPKGTVPVTAQHCHPRRLDVGLHGWGCGRHSVHRFVQQAWLRRHKMYGMCENKQCLLGRPRLNARGTLGNRSFRIV